jgi:iron complex transport system substrate-binding protein
MYPQRIVCLTEEPTEVLYALGEQDRIVGISGYTVRPARARREKPRVSAFTSAKTELILALRPHLVVGFSDLQADIARELIKAGVEVWISNHRSVAGITAYVRRLGALVGAAERAHYVLAAATLAAHGLLHHLSRRAYRYARRGPRIG